MDEATYACNICPDVLALNEHDMVEHFEVVHPFIAAVARHSASCEDDQRASAWLN